MSNTRRRLTECAFELFGRHGFHAIGLDAILAEAGVSKQTFYNHFDSKDALVLAVLEHRHTIETAVFESLFHARAGDDPRARLYALFDVLEAWFDLPDWRGCIFVTAAAEFPLQTEPAHRIAAGHFEGFRHWLEQLARDAGARQPQRLADELVVLVEGLVAVRHVTGRSTYTAVARRMARTMLDQQFRPDWLPLPHPAAARPGCVGS